MNLQQPLVRLAVAAAVIALAVGGLWAAGVLFQDEEAPTVRSGDGVSELFAADASLDTPGSETREVGLQAGDLAPDFEFSSFDGERLRLSDFRGRPVFLNFWASWCGPCRHEMPNMMTMLELYGQEANGLAVIAVNNGEAFEPAQRFLDRYEIELTEIAFDPSQQIVNRYEVFLGLPVSYFIDAEGVITRVVHGEVSFDVMQSSVQEAIGGYKQIAN